MPDLAAPLPLEYDGWDANDHRVDAQKLGLSLQGVGRLYRSTYQYYLTGQMPTRLVNSDVRVLVGPPTPGSLSYAIWVLMAHGKLIAYPALIAEFVDLCVPEFVKAMLAKRGGQTKAMADAIDKLHDLAKDNAELARRFADFAQDVHRGHVDEKGPLYEIIEQLSQRNSSAMIEMVAPVGYSVRKITNAKGQEAEFVIDEPTADVIRAKGDLEVLDEITMTVRLGAVDMISRTCKVTSPEFPKPIRCKITDPAIMVPHNVYTHALDATEEVVIKAKPALKDGEIHVYYISDAKPAR